MKVFCVAATTVQAFNAKTITETIMSRKKVTVVIGSSKPRNRIVRALIGGLVSRGTGRHVEGKLKRSQTKNDVDLDQRVRESGEW